MPIDNTAKIRAAAVEAGGKLEVSEERLQCVLELSTDYYWEQDEQLCYTLFRHRTSSALARAARKILGKTRWELGGRPLVGSWQEHRAICMKRQPFTDFVVCRRDLDGREKYFSISGQPVFDGGGRFCGYRGIAKDVTAQKRDERLLRLEVAVTRILSDAKNVTEALQAAVRAICESEGWDAGQYWSLDEQANVMRFHGGCCIAGQAVQRIVDQARDFAIRPGAGLVGVVWQTGEPLWRLDLSREKLVRRKAIAERAGWSAVLFPVRCEGKIIGVLDFNGRNIPEPDERLLQLMRVLGSGIGSFYQRAVAHERLCESEERYASTVELAAIGIGHVAPDGRFVHVNQRFCEMLGYEREELLQLTVKGVSHPEDIDATEGQRPRILSGEISAYSTEKRYLRKDGIPIWVRITIALKRDASGEHLYDISVVEDISERKRAEERVRYLATHDEMTKLPNRSMFGQLLTRAIEAAVERNTRLAVLFIDLDRFKIVNDSLGHEAGDELLKEMSSRLRSCVRKGDVVARLGGDEFVVLAEGIGEPGDAAEIARKILAAAIRPVEITGQECRVTASVGIAVFPGDADDAQALMKNADMAMYLAKEDGKNNYQFYSKTVSTLTVGRLALENNLRRALEQNELTLHYQPKVDIRTGVITGVEALVRWWNSNLGTIPPAQFIPIAEDIGLIVPIGKWVLKSACAQNVAWQREGLPPVCMAVNLSLRQFKDARLLDDIAEALEETGMDARLLELEITEGVMLDDVEQVIEKLSAIKGMGVRLAIDDFGTGYSSLAHLRRFPFDTLKVDRSFIREVPHDPDDQAIAEAIIAMGRTLGVTVVAEGVETAEQENFLRSRACDEMQGYLFSKPAPPAVFARLLRGYAPSPPTLSDDDILNE